MKPKEIMYPQEYFSAMVFWAVKVSELKGISLADAMLEYTDLYGSLTEEEWDKRFESKLWQDFLEEVGHSKDPELISDIVYKLYLKQNHSVYSAKIEITDKLQDLGDRVTCGPLVLAYDEYNRERNSVRIHYNPTRSEESWLASSKFPELQAAFVKLLKYSKANYDAKYFTSSTWLNNVPNFQRLFPDSFNQNLKDIGAGTYLGLWGQFVKSNGEGNVERLQEFLEKLQMAEDFESAVKSIPLKVLEGVGEIEEFYRKYDL